MSVDPNSKEIQDICLDMSYGDDSHETVRKYLQLVERDSSDEAVQKEIEDMFDIN